MVDSNWSWSDEAGQYYLHRFYPFQPDLNYAEPAVTAAMIRNGRGEVLIYQILFNTLTD